MGSALDQGKAGSMNRAKPAASIEIGLWSKRFVDPIGSQRLFEVPLGPCRRWGVPHDPAHLTEPADLKAKGGVKRDRSMGRQVFWAPPHSHCVRVSVVVLQEFRRAFYHGL